MPTAPIKFLDQSSLKICFTDKLVTAYGGFSVLAKLFEKIKLRGSLEKIIPFAEISPNGTGGYAKILRFALTVIAGGSRFTHSAFLGDSIEIYQETFGVRRIPRSVSALTRFFLRFSSWQVVERFSDGLWSYVFAQIIPFGLIREDHLTFDSTVITRHGTQQGSKVGYNPQKRGRPSHHPILAFLNRSKYIVNLWNRSGNTSSGNGIVEFVKQTTSRLGGRIKILGCLADSGFYDIGFIQYLESACLPYVIAAKLYGVLQSKVVAIDEWTKVDKGIDVAEFFFQHTDEKWEKSRRYIAIRQKISESPDTAKGRQLSLFKDDECYTDYRYGLYVTSKMESAVDIWRLYRLRAGDEGVIKETKYDFGLEGFCLENFYATEAAMLLRVLFYNIINLFRTQCLPEKEKHQTMHTLRLKYFVIPAFLGCCGRDTVLRLGVRSKERRQKIIWLFHRIDEVFSKCIAFETVEQTREAPVT